MTMCPEKEISEREVAFDLAVSNNELDSWSEGERKG